MRRRRVALGSILVFGLALLGPFGVLNLKTLWSLMGTGPAEVTQIPSRNNQPRRSPTSSTTTTKKSDRCKALPPESLPLHGCRSHETTWMVFCRIQNLQIHVDKVNCTQGGENLTEVIQQRKHVMGYPEYQKGAFATRTKMDVPDNLDLREAHYIKDVLAATTIDSNQNCTSTISTPTLFITRYEYVNLYHTMTDFFNAYLSLPQNQSTQVVFLDGHAAGNLDHAWNRLFGNVTRVKQLSPNICHENAILIPPGYSAPIWKRNRFISPCPSMMTNFVDDVLSKFQIQEEMQRGRVTIIERVPYISHPSSDFSKAQRIIKNLSDLREQLNELKGVQAELVRLEEHDLEHQIRLIRGSQVLIGNHGAGMSHLLFLHSGAHAMEFETGNSMFFEFAIWKPEIKYHWLPSASTKLRSSIIQKVVKEVKQAIPVQ